MAMIGSDEWMVFRCRDGMDGLVLVLCVGIGWGGRPLHGDWLDGCGARALLTYDIPDTQVLGVLGARCSGIAIASGR